MVKFVIWYFSVIILLIMNIHVQHAECNSTTVKREMLVAIIFGSFENNTIWWRFNLAIILEERGGLNILFIWWKLILANFFNSPNKSSPIIYRFTVLMIRTVLCKVCIVCLASFGRKVAKWWSSTWHDRLIEGGCIAFRLHLPTEAHIIVYILIYRQTSCTSHNSQNHV